MNDDLRLQMSPQIHVLTASEVEDEYGVKIPHLIESFGVASSCMRHGAENSVAAYQEGVKLEHSKAKRSTAGMHCSSDLHLP